MRKSAAFAALCVMALGWIVSGGSSRAQDAAVPAVDPQARALVEAMATSLAALTVVRAEAEYAFDVVLETGQKLQYGGATTSTFRRPDAMRTDRIGERASTVLNFDGKHVTLHVMPQNFYATSEAPPTIDAMLDFAIDRLDVMPPGADLMYSDGGRALLEGVTSGIYVGVTQVAGRLCHHVAFRAPDVDWQLWIEDGERALPCRYVITTLDVERTPEMSVTFRAWDTTPELSADSFRFVPPEGAKPIAFGEIGGERDAANEEVAK